MKICINTDILKENNLSLSEFLLLWLSSDEYSLSKVKNSLAEKGWIYPESCKIHGLPALSMEAKTKVASMLIDSTPVNNKNTNSDAFYTEVAEAIREFYPKGKKPGTAYMWRDSIPTIARRLKLLNIKYGYTFTKEQAIKATEEYVNSFNNDYRYMQLLKYFILKVPVNANGDVEVRSEFMSYIENEGQNSLYDENWTNELK